MKSCFSRLRPFLKGQCFVVFGVVGRIAKGVIPAHMRFLVLIFSLMVFSGKAATWYVDSSVSSSGNGTSWSLAWETLGNITGVSSGDTVYISGGPSGSSQTYPNGSFQPKSGVHYQIGQDSLHNGIAHFIGGGATFGSGVYNGPHWDGSCTNDNLYHFLMDGYGQYGSGNNSPDINWTVNNVTFTNSPPSGAWIIANESNCVFYNIYDYVIPNGGNCGYWMHAIVQDNPPTNGGFGQYLVWSNVNLYTPNCGSSAAGNIGMSCLGTAGGGITIEDCTLVSYATNSSLIGSGSQHCDGLQLLCGTSPAADYVLIRNNFIFGYLNYDIYFDPDGPINSANNSNEGSFNYLFCYNNVCLNYSTGWSGGGAISSNGSIVGADNIPGTSTTWIVVNNDCEESTSSGQFHPCDGASGITVNELVGANNICIDQPMCFNCNVGSGPFTTITPLINTANPEFSSTVAEKNFISYAQNMSPYNINMRLLTNANSLIGQGTNLTTLFNSYGLSTADAAGNPRPATGNWDIGAYQYNSSGTLGTLPAPPTPTIELVSP
jgi:hypothetical protein